MTGKITNPKIEIFCEGLDHPEGLAFAPDGYLYCGGEAGQIYRISPNGKSVEQVASTGGFHLGLAFSPDGWLLICDCKQGTLWRHDPVTRETTAFARELAGRPLGHLNYPVFRRDGCVYVSESGEWGQNDGRILLFQPQGSGEVWLDGLDFPNGLALSLDEGELFVALSRRDEVARIRSMPEGGAGQIETVASNLESVPDGLAFDQARGLYVSCFGNNNVCLVQPDGSKSLFATDPTSLLLNRATNLTFGGAEDTSLYVANLGGWHISKLQSPSPGQPLAGPTR